MIGVQCFNYFLINLKVKQPHIFGGIFLKERNDRCRAFKKYAKKLGEIGAGKNNN